MSEAIRVFGAKIEGQRKSRDCHRMPNDNKGPWVSLVRKNRGRREEGDVWGELTTEATPEEHARDLPRGKEKGVGRGKRQEGI